MTTLQKITALNWFDFLRKIKDILLGISAEKIAEAPIDGSQYARQDGKWSEVTGGGGGGTTNSTVNNSTVTGATATDAFNELQNNKVEKDNIYMTLPSPIIIDESKKYYITSGIIKPSLTDNVDNFDVEIISNPTNGASLAIDLTDFPWVELQGGGFSESPANYYTLETALGDGLLKQHLTLMMWRRGNLFISNSMNYLPYDYGDSIANFSNVLAYWKEGVGDNSTGTYSKTDMKNGKVLTATGYGNPTLSGSEWIFDGVNDGFSLADSAINNLLNADNREFQIHFKGNYKNAASSRIVCATNITNGVADGNTNFAYKAGTGNVFIAMQSSSTLTVSQDTALDISLNVDYLFSLKYYMDGAINKVDLYIDNGTTIVSYLGLNINSILNSNISKLFIGMRELAGQQFYNIGFKSMVIANSTVNFDTIRGLIRP